MIIDSVDGCERLLIKTWQNMMTLSTYGVLHWQRPRECVNFIDPLHWQGPRACAKPRSGVSFGRIVKSGTGGVPAFQEYFPKTGTRATTENGDPLAEEVIVDTNSGTK